MYLFILKKKKKYSHVLPPKDFRVKGFIYLFLFLILLLHVDFM